MNILDQTLGEMPVMFTSYEFTKQARINGLNEKLIINGIVAPYLKKHTARISRSTWNKKSGLDLQSAAKPVQLKIESEIDSAISLLKKNGYKVMKPSTEWKEL